MSNTLRSWLAALGLALSVFVFTIGAAPRDLGPRVLPFLLVVLAQAWVIVVAERIGSDRGGVEIKRFPIGPRLLLSKPSLTVQMLVFLGLFGATTGDWRSAVIGLVILTVASIDVLRGLLPFILPALAAVYALLTMKEFHTLGDLVATARGWALSLFMIIVWSFLLCGTLLRTDVGPRLNRQGKAIAMLAGLPTYTAALWIFTRTNLAGRWPDLFAIGLVMLAGGLVQSIVMTALSSAAGLRERLPVEMPAVNGHDVGLALMPMMLPILACMSLAVLPLGDVITAAVLPETWLGLLCLVLLVPAVLTAGLIGAGLDHLERGGRSRVPMIVVVGCFAGWLVGGPSALAWIYGPEGLAATVQELLPLADRGSPVVAGVAEQASLAGPLFSGTLTLYTTPVVDLVRAVTLMMLACGGLSVRLLRHAPHGLRSPRWGLFAIALVALAASCWLLLPRLGFVGVPLAVTLSCLVMMLVDQLAGVAEVVVEERGIDYGDDDFDDPVVAEEDGAAIDEQPDYEIGFDPGILEVPSEVLVDGDSIDMDDDADDDDAVDDLYDDSLIDDLRIEDEFESLDRDR